MKEGVVGAKEQVGTVAPGTQVEEELPCALRHLGSISRMEAASLRQGLWVRRWVDISTGGCSFWVGRARSRDFLGWAVFRGGVGGVPGPVPTVAWSNQSPRVPAKG